MTSFVGRAFGRLRVLGVFASLSACSLQADPIPSTYDGQNSALLRTAITVNDLDASRHFYSYGLGFETRFDGDITSPWVTEILQLESGQTVRFAVLVGAETIAGKPVKSAMVGLLQVDNPPLVRKHRPEGVSLVQGEAILAMETADIEALKARLIELDTNIVFGPSRSVDGTEFELVFYDPDGIRIHVVQRQIP